MFRSREIPRLAQQGIYPPSDAFTVVETNDQVDKFNADFLRTLDTEACQSPSMDVCLGEGSAQARQRELERVQGWPISKTQGLPRNLEGRVSAPYMVTVNLATPDGLTNGSCGTLRHIQWGRTGDGQRIPIRLYIEFADESVGRQTRADNRAVMARDGVDGRLTPIERVSRSFVARLGSLFKIVRKQFPLVVCKALTVWKCQGSTMRAVVVVMREERRMERRPFYVGTSRATSLQGLFIEGTYRRPAAPGPNDSVLVEVQRLELPENAVEFSIQFPELHTDGEGLVALFHNIVSLCKHHSHVLQDLSYTRSDIIMLCETRTMPLDDISIPGFELLHRRDCVRATRHPFGTTLYVRQGLSGRVEVIFDEPSVTVWRDCHLHSFVDVVGILLSGQRTAGIVFLHRSPQSTMSNFRQHFGACMQSLQERGVETITVVGDFNINLQDATAATPLLRYMGGFGLQIMVDETAVSTDNGTLIDLCFSNDTSVRSYITESVISDHKPVWFKLDRL
ncbi:ATP-dependent DNA helicase [Frankliniella fusca]|uniref:ATP-dependent DNA helicase n=1 Tax=Frankliniella fusca TaxID=407009 RepID=A0AAE1I0M3_9NEOP|nr:ATP-dependent DNA helicase [Frankliniella fusca]KAK3930120.1 ATP-dependent DNA helicase [Frankliniella fusca]